MLDWVESEVTQWAEGLITEHFGVEDPNDLTREQMIEVCEVYEQIDTDYGDTLSIGFLNVIRWWESENEDEVL
jgi:hypothetical protein